MWLRSAAVSSRDDVTTVYVNTIDDITDEVRAQGLLATREAEFRMLAVLPSARGRGVGETLVQACVAKAKQDGLSRIVLSTGPEMLAAHRLYERMGFRRATERDWSPRPGIELRAYVMDF